MMYEIDKVESPQHKLKLLIQIRRKFLWKEYSGFW